ncbi:hypothetical protein TPY_0616 [Sulfobacillus acidophilus TPY]|nr:hypothetical protein TPY_0616 [Sulfobacillus acidophilus TPY]
MVWHLLGLMSRRFRGIWARFRRDAIRNRPGFIIPRDMLHGFLAYGDSGVTL